jgi:hypothetical protein
MLKYGGLRAVAAGAKVRGGMPEDRGRMPEDRGQRIEDRWRREVKHLV